MDTPRRSGDDPGSILRDNAITIDLRERPTRADLGFQDGRNDRSYSREAGQPPITTTVVLPTGTVRLPAFVISADGADATPAGRANERAPERIVVQRRFAAAAEVAAGLGADATALGLDRPEVDVLVARVSASLDSPAPQQGVLNGLVHDWLAAWVEVIGHADGTVGVNYTFTVNEFHNEAVDKVVRDGMFPVDLTRRPTRGDLAFRDTYSLARVQPAWTETLTVRLTLAGGTLERRVERVDSSTTATGSRDPGGTGEPVQMIVTLPPSSVADADRTLRADAAALGLNPSDVDGVLAGPAGRHVRATLEGDRTRGYDVTVSVEATLGQQGSFAAAVAYRFTFH